MVLELLDRHLHPASDFLPLVILEELQVFLDDGLAAGAVKSKMLDLQQEALLQPASRHADRVESLDHAKHPLDLGAGPVTHLGDLLDRCHQIPVVIEVADDH